MPSRIRGRRISTMIRRKSVESFSGWPVASHQKILPQIAQRKGHRPEPQRQQRPRTKQHAPAKQRATSTRHAERRRQAVAHRLRKPSLALGALRGAAPNRSGCRARASCSMASTSRGDGMADRFAQHDDAAVAHRFQVAPAGPAAQLGDLRGALCSRIVARKDQILRLQRAPPLPD